MSVIDTLIYDRTQSDVSNDTDKSYISYSDLNRIEEAVKYLSELMNKYNYKNSVNVKTSWNMSEFRKQEDCNRIKSNFEVLKNAFPYKFDIPEFKWETIEEANRIEKILYEIDFIIFNMRQNFMYGGVPNLGQERVWQQRFRRVIEPLNYEVFGNVEQATRSGNIFDSLFEQGQINTDNGALSSSSGTIRTKNYIKVVKGYNYKITRSIYTDYMYFRFYDKDYNYLGNQTIEGFVETDKSDNRMVGGQSQMILKILNSDIQYMKIGDVSNDLSVIYTMTTDGLPTPDYPSEVYGLGSERTNNLFEVNNEYIVLGKEVREVIVKNNSVRIYPNGDFGTGAWISILYKIKDITNDIGKIGRIKMDFVHTGEVAPRYVIGVCNEDGSKRTQIGTASVKSGIETACVIPEITDEKKYLCVWMYLSGGAIVKKDDYTEFSNIVATIDDTHLEYIPKKNLKLKQKIGNNIFDKTKCVLGGNWNGSIGSTCYPFQNQTSRAVILLKAKSNQKYFMKLIKNNWFTGQIMEVDRNFKILQNILEGWNEEFEKSFTTTKNTEYIGIKFAYGDRSATITNEMFESLMLQINEGEKSPYVPFIENSQFIDLTNHEPLMKIGDVEDYIDYEKGKILRRIGKVTISGGNWQNYNASAEGFYKAYNVDYKLGTSNDLLDEDKAKCTHFKVLGSISKLQGAFEGISFTKNAVYISISSSTASNLEELKTWLTNNPITIWYELAEPYYEDIELPVIQKISGEYSLTAYDEYLDGRVERE